VFLLVIRKIKILLLLRDKQTLSSKQILTKLAKINNFLLTKTCQNKLIFTYFSAGHQSNKMAAE
jgi:hypothetical protein